MIKKLHRYKDHTFCQKIIQSQKRSYFFVFAKRSYILLVVKDYPFLKRSPNATRRNAKDHPTCHAIKDHTTKKRKRRSWATGLQTDPRCRPQVRGLESTNSIYPLSPKYSRMRIRPCYSNERSPSSETRAVFQPYLLSSTAFATPLCSPPSVVSSVMPDSSTTSFRLPLFMPLNTTRVDRMQYGLDIVGVVL